MRLKIKIDKPVNKFYYNLFYCYYHYYCHLFMANDLISRASTIKEYKAFNLTIVIFYRQTNFKSMIKYLTFVQSYNTVRIIQ